MANEKKTENLVRDQLRELAYGEPSTKVDEQKSEIEAVKRLLKAAGKAGKGGSGSPEFIISSDEFPHFLVIVECKANVKFHQSGNLSKPVLYAVDGVLHYAKYLSKEFNVIAVGVSGDTKSSMKVSTFLWPKGAATHRPLTTKSGAAISSLLAWSEYLDHANFDPTIQKALRDDLMEFSRDLHVFMRDHAKLTESEKPLLVSGTLIALQNQPFLKSYDSYKPAELQKQWLHVIREEIEKAELPQAKKNNMVQPYSTISVHPELGKPTPKYPKGVLFELIDMINERVLPTVNVFHDFDLIGQFYGEFLKYTGGDKKALGIVLTPRHVTDLFARLANVTKTSTVLDLCAGTAGFLVSAMYQMMQQAVTEKERARIKKSGLIGVENQPNMYALAASNMILRGDGKANLYQGSCFTPAIIEDIKKFKCDVGLLNPPYSQGEAGLHELMFVKQMLDCLVKGGRGIAIVPMSCAISPHPLREELMKLHTLEAVMSMPAELFYPVGTVVCTMVWTAGTPHEAANQKTWFGYWKDDGFVKTKHKGRVDLAGNWQKTRDAWVEMFRNREVHAGLSVTRRVTFGDEWCAEAYMATDYSHLSPADFAAVTRDYASARLKRPTKIGDTVALKPKTWKLFQLGKLFDIKKGKRLTKANMKPGLTPFIGAIDDNNGITAYIEQPALHPGKTMTVNYNGNGVAEAFYQPVPYRCSDDVHALYPRFELTPRIALFLATVIRQEKYRFSYGRKWHLARMEKAEIRLPATESGEPDWKFMELYISGMPFSDSLQ